MPAEQSILDLIANELGAVVVPRSQPTVRTIGIASDQLVPQNPQRVALVLVNLSANTLYVAVGQLASVTQGIRLGPNGGQLIMNWKEDLTLPAEEWSILASGAASAYYLIELVLA